MRPWIFAAHLGRHARGAHMWGRRRLPLSQLQQWPGPRLDVPQTPRRRRRSALRHPREQVGHAHRKGADVGQPIHQCPPCPRCGAAPMTLSPAFVALAAAAAWFLIFFFLHIVGLRAGFANARWLLISYAACFLGPLVTAIALTAWQHGMQAVILAATMAGLTSACLFALYVPALYTVLTSLSVQTMMLLRRRGGTL